MIRIIPSFSIIAAIVCLPSVRILAQDPQLPGAVEEHAFLDRFTGEWETHTDYSFGPDQPAIKCQGTMKSRMLGEIWLVSESEFTVAGTTENALQTIGYDAAKKKYVGTWVDSMVNHMWKYEGTVEGDKLTLEAEGPNFTGNGKLTKFQDTYEFRSDNELVTTSRMMGEDGEWVTFMTGTATRKK